MLVFRKQRDQMPAAPLLTHRLPGIAEVWSGVPVWTTLVSVQQAESEKGYLLKGNGPMCSVHSPEMERERKNSISLPLLE